MTEGGFKTLWRFLLKKIVVNVGAGEALNKTSIEEIVEI